MKNFKFILFFIINISLYAGVEFSILFKSSVGNIHSRNKIKCRIKDENIRFDFLFPFFKNENELEQNYKKLVIEGVYWIYNFKKGIFLVVNPYELSYNEFTDKIISKSNKKISSIKNLKIQVNEIMREKINNFNCRHFLIIYSYDYIFNYSKYEKHILVEARKEIWIANDVLFKDFPLNLKKFLFSFSTEEIDSFISENIKISDTEFIIKQIDIKKIISGGNKEEYYNEMMISNISKYDIPEEIFLIPKNYKKIELDFKK